MALKDEIDQLLKKAKGVRVATTSRLGRRIRIVKKLRIDLFQGSNPLANTAQGVLFNEVGDVKGGVCLAIAGYWIRSILFNELPLFYDLALGNWLHFGVLQVATERRQAEVRESRDNLNRMMAVIPGGTPFDVSGIAVQQLILFRTNLITSRFVFDSLLDGFFVSFDSRQLPDDPVERPTQFGALVRRRILIGQVGQYLVLLVAPPPAAPTTGAPPPEPDPGHAIAVSYVSDHEVRFIDANSCEFICDSLDSFRQFLIDYYRQVYESRRIVFGSLKIIKYSREPIPIQSTRPKLITVSDLGTTSASSSSSTTTTTLPTNPDALAPDAAELARLRRGLLGATR
jgi:hypothetical protein